MHAPWLNYHHLLYFYTVAREGSVSAAAASLHLTPSTISAQIQQLESTLGTELFERRGRGLALTESGRVAMQYAAEIFSLGREFRSVIAGRPAARPSRLAVGTTDAVPKHITFRLLEPLRRLPEPPIIECRDDTPGELLTALAAHDLDLVITDSPPTPASPVRVYAHLLGESSVTIFGTPELANRYRRDFPHSLDDAPFLLPTEHAALRRHLDQWFDSLGIRPQVRGVFADSALLGTFGQAGVGLFAAPSAIAAEVKRQFAVRALGTARGLRESYYAITSERKIKHPAAVRLTEIAQTRLFA